MNWAREKKRPFNGLIAFLILVFAAIAGFSAPLRGAAESEVREELKAEDNYKEEIMELREEIVDLAETEIREEIEREFIQTITEEFYDAAPNPIIGDPSGDQPMDVLPVEPIESPVGE